MMFLLISNYSHMSKMSSPFLYYNCKESVSCSDGPQLTGTGKKLDKLTKVTNFISSKESYVLFQRKQPCLPNAQINTPAYFFITKSDTPRRSFISVFFDF